MTTETKTKRNCEALTFDQWLARANKEIERLVGLSLDDLPDRMTWDAWDAGENPAEFAREALADEGYEFEGGDE
jgi:hypothetical protein